MAYATDSVVGILVIALSILVPGMPGMPLIMKMGPETPPGWSYNPASWYQRAPVIALSFVGLFISRYLAAYQLGYIDLPTDEARRAVLSRLDAAAIPHAEADGVVTVRDPWQNVILLQVVQVAGDQAAGLAPGQAGVR